ncbi:hypothetical protein Patl1_08528 [Pistacia atlantica]|uniref:Uncharacterized protein n=1 Tax=Pistacia atlantica TaxID=434234 RepID=A0ACC1AKH3_9ROSI|nr:hypothetical protein Patl1_08528 [Pistacia atlantica]
MQAGIDQKVEDEKIKATQEALEHCKNNLEVVINVFKQEKTGILSDTLGPSCHEENDVSLEIPTHGENGEVMEVTQASSELEMEIELNSIEVANELATKEVFEVGIVGLPQVVLEHKETKKVNLGNTNMGVPQKQNDPHGEAFETACNGGKHVEELACESEKIFEEVDVAIEQEEDKKAKGSMRKEGEIEKENVRKVDKIKEREREKEKENERIVVERAVCKAHERVFPEA